MKAQRVQLPKAVDPCLGLHEDSTERRSMPPPQLAKWRLSNELLLAEEGLGSCRLAFRGILREDGHLSAEFWWHAALSHDLEISRRQQKGRRQTKVSNS